MQQMHHHIPPVCVGPVGIEGIENFPVGGVPPILLHPDAQLPIVGPALILELGSGDGIEEDRAVQSEASTLAISIEENSLEADPTILPALWWVRGRIWAGRVRTST